MSDREFDNYLTLLASLLRLDGRQRKQIAEELRAHLEDRLGDLVVQGVPHDEAVQRALSEFGDAAGLAASFANISRGRKRRWLMRVTTFSIAATLLIAAGILTFWPGRNAAPGTAEAVAQAPQAVPQDAAAAPRDEAAQTAIDDRQREFNDVLNRRMNMQYQDVPLKEIAANLTEQTGVTFYVSEKKLEEAGLNGDTPVISHFRNIRLSTWLDLVLNNLELTYTVRDDVIIITTPEDAESRLEVRVYDCRDLLAMPAPVGADKLLPPRPRSHGGMGGGMFAVQDAPAGPAAGAADGTKGQGQPASPAPATPAPAGMGGGGMGGMGGGNFGESEGPRTEHDLSAEKLISILENNVEPQSWDTVGGVGAISEYNGLLVVTQTMQTHKEVERVLDMLREAAGLPGPGKVVR